MRLSARGRILRAGCHRESPNGQEQAEDTASGEEEVSWDREHGAQAGKEEAMSTKKHQPSKPIERPKDGERKDVPTQSTGP